MTLLSSLEIAFALWNNRIMHLSQCVYVYMLYLSPLLYGIASAAGAPLFLDVAARIAIGIRYGSINRNWKGIFVPVA
jgi:hypothetical protein